MNKRYSSVEHTSETLFHLLKSVLSFFEKLLSFFVESEQQKTLYCLVEALRNNIDLENPTTAQSRSQSCCSSMPLNKLTGIADFVSELYFLQSLDYFAFFIQ